MKLTFPAAELVGSQPSVQTRTPYTSANFTGGWVIALPRDRTALAVHVRWVASHRMRAAELSALTPRPPWAPPGSPEALQPHQGPGRQDVWPAGCSDTAPSGVLGLFLHIWRCQWEEVGAVCCKAIANLTPGRTSRHSATSEETNQIPA